MMVFQDRTWRWFGGFAVVAAFLLFVLTRGCSFAGGPVSGRVRDVDTLQPIEGAIVVVQWSGVAHGLAHSSYICFHVETAVSDKDGKFHMPLWLQAPPRWSIFGTSTMRDAYLPGYESVSTYKTYTESPEDVFMKKFTRGQAARFEYISHRVFGAMDCVNAEASLRNLYPLLKIAFREAKSLANSPNERAELNGMREMAATIWLAEPSDSPVEPEPLAKVPTQIRRDLE
jgi:hypothetical protein